MSPHELLDIVYHGSEERNIEYKRGMNWDNPQHRSKIIKTMLGMANIEDGGFIVLGVKQEDDGSFAWEGVSEQNAELFDQDNMDDKVYNYADPPIEFTVRKINGDEYKSDENKIFVVIQIREFSEIPVICKSDDGCELRCGAIYTRTRGKRETSEIRSQYEMREIIDIAL